MTAIPLDAALQYVAVAYKARQAKREAEELDKGASDAIKAYFAGSGERDLVDYEHGLAATLQTRNGANTLDLVAMAQHDPELLVLLGKAGALRADVKAVDGQPMLAKAVDYLVGGTQTTALMITVLK